VANFTCPPFEIRSVSRLAPGTAKSYRLLSADACPPRVRYHPFPQPDRTTNIVTITRTGCKIPRPQKYPPFAILYQDPPAPTRDAARIVVALPAVLNEELEWARDIPVLSMHGMREWMGKRVSEKLEKLGARAKEVVGGRACCTTGVFFPMRT